MSDWRTSWEDKDRKGQTVTHIYTDENGEPTLYVHKKTEKINAASDDVSNLITKPNTEEKA